MPLNKASFISVIMPAYNCAEYIADSIDSVLKQNYGKYKCEIIVIDDGSTDDTEKVVRSFGNKVVYKKIPHSGKPAVPRNVGLSLAKGELIAFQDSDDLWLPNKIEQQLGCFDDPNIILAYANAEVMNADGTPAHELVVEPNKLKSGENFEGLIKENVISTSTVVARKSALASVGNFDESDNLRAIEDYKVWLMISAKYSNSVKPINKVFAKYRRHEKNISKGSQLQSIEKIIRVYEALWDASLDDCQRLALEIQTNNMQENWSRVSKDNASNPAISVVLSVYNGGDHLKGAIQSILDQTYKNFEFIIIDDGSTDKSAEIVKSFKDPRIRLVRQVNHGLVYSLNKGVKLARGAFIARFDADDLSMPTRFEKELAWIIKSPSRGLVGSFFTYIDEGRSSIPSVTLYTPTKHIDLCRMMYFVNPLAHGSTMFRKKAFEGAGGYRQKYYRVEDYDLWRRIAPHWEIGQLPESLYWYRISSNGISQIHNKEQNKLAKKVANEQFKTAIYAKSVKQILEDLKYYKNLNSEYSTELTDQYIHQQKQLAFEFLIRGWLRTGYKTALAAILMRPVYTKDLWKIILWAPLKRILGKKLK